MRFIPPRDVAKDLSKSLRGNGVFKCHKALLFVIKLCARHCGAAKVMSLPQTAKCDLGFQML
eukprot:8132564-Heterocapsa_arctica.AAC.1